MIVGEDRERLVQIAVAIESGITPPPNCPDAAFLRKLATDPSGKSCPTCGSEDFCSPTKCANPWHGASPEQVVVARIQNDPEAFLGLLRSLVPVVATQDFGSDADLLEYIANLLEGDPSGEQGET